MNRLENLYEQYRLAAILEDMQNEEFYLWSNFLSMADWRVVVKNDYFHIN